MHEKNIEIEFRYEVLDKVAIEKFIKDLTFLSEQRVIDTYLDTTNGDYFKQSVFIRIRNSKKLDFKFNLKEFLAKSKTDAHEECNEYSFTIPLISEQLSALDATCQILGMKTPSKADLKLFKRQNQLIDHYTLDKKRTNYSAGLNNEYTISLDEIDGLGLFLEIEYMADETENIEEIKKKMLQYIGSLPLKRVQTGYCEIYMKKNDFNLYKEGRYLMEEDR